MSNLPAASRKMLCGCFLLYVTEDGRRGDRDAQFGTVDPLIRCARTL